MVKEISRSYEAKVKKKYSEFDKVGIGTWNAVDFKGRFVNMYVDEEMIRELFTNRIVENFRGRKKDLVILDFGGGDGSLVSTIKRQLGREFNVDHYNLDLNDDSLNLCKEKNKGVKVVKHNILEQYKKKSADVILCRLVMQYQSKEGQLKIIKNAYNTLTKEGLFFVLWPFHNNKEYFNTLESEVVHIITGKDKEIALQSRHFPVAEEMKETIEKAGFEVIFMEDKEMKQYYTVRGWSDRFNLTKSQENQLTNVFNTFEKKYPEIFEMKEGLQTHHSIHCLIVAKKISF